MSKPTTLRRKDLRNRSRGRILSAARDLFAQQGYDATTMEQIAGAASTSVGNLYFHFTNKEALLREVVLSDLSEDGERVDRQLASIDPGPLAVAVGMYTYLEAIFAESQIARIFLLGQKHQAVRADVVDAIVERIQERLPRHIREMNATEARLTAVAEVGAVFFLIEAQLAGNIDVTPDEFFRFATRLRLRIFGLPPEEEDSTIQRAEAAVGWQPGLSWEALEGSQVGAN
jgi:AcrR family transcriptional regulator